MNTLELTPPSTSTDRRLSASVTEQPLDPAKAPTILLVDDNPLVARALTMLLEKSGYQTVAFHSAQPALDYSRSATPNAAVVDIHLPDLSGLVLARAMRDQFGPTVPIIICSGDTSMDTLNSLHHVGATYFVPKPIQGSKLIEQLRALLNV